MKCLLNHVVLMGLVVVLGVQSRSAGAAAPRPGPAQAAVIARLHAVGFQQLGADANGTVFKEVWNLPASAQLRNEALNKLAAALAASFVPKPGSTPGNCAGLIRPLLSDLCTAETVAEVIEHPEGALECTLALRLDEDRSRLWQATWSRLTFAWEPKASANGNRLSFLATNSWVAIHNGPAGTPNASLVMLKISQGQRPVAEAREDWLKAEADWPRLTERVRHGRGKDLPKMELSVTGRKEYLLSQMHLTFRDPVVSRVETWQIPTDTIRDPLISFSAVQGVAGWLKRQPLVQELGLNTTPNQVYLWGLSQTPFQIQAAVPIPDATNAFQRIAGQWAPRFNQTLVQYALGQVRPLTNQTELIWRGLPILVPYLEPQRDGGREYLHAGIFPVNSSTNPAPTALFEQLSTQPNLVYYDWEITQARLDQLRPLVQLAAIFLTVSPMSTNSITSKWLDVVQPRLGNTVTEGTLASPREVNLVRTSHLGLNGLELLTLANWLEGTNFPRASFDIHFRPAAKLARPQESR